MSFPPQPHHAAFKRNSSLAAPPLRHLLQWRPLVLGPKHILPGAIKCDPQLFSLLSHSDAGVERRLLFVQPLHSDSHRCKRVEQPSGSGSIGICECQCIENHFVLICDPLSTMNFCWSGMGPTLSRCSQRCVSLFRRPTIVCCWQVVASCVGA